MSRWLPELRRRLRRQPVSVLLLTADARVRPWPEGFATGDAEAPSDAVPFAQWCERHPHARCELYAGADALHQVSPPPGEPWPGPANGLAYARQLLAHFHGDEALTWPVWLWVSRCRGTSMRWGASALHADPLRQLDAVAARHGVSVVAVRPLWTWVAADLPCSRTLLHEDGWATELMAQDGQLTKVSQRRSRVPGSDPWQDDDGQPADAMARHRFAPGSPRPGGAEATGERGPRVARVGWPHRRLSIVTTTGLEQRAATPWPAWVAMILALSGVIALAADAWQAFDERRVALDEQSRWQAVWSRTRATPATPASTADAGWSRDTGTQGTKAAIAELMARKLAYPWGELLHSVETAGQPAVQWLRLEHDSDQGMLRLEGSAPSLDHAAEAARRLESSGAWSRAWMARTQPGTSAADVRFELEAVGRQANESAFDARSRRP